MSQQISPTLDQAKAALNNVQNMVQDLLTQRSTLLSRRQEIFDERESLLLQPLSKAEVMQAVCDVIDRRAEYYQNRLKKQDFFDGIAFPVERGYGNPKPPRYDYPLAIFDLDQITGKPAPYARDPKMVKPRPELKELGWHLPIFPKHGEHESTWHYFFLGDLLKQKICILLADGEEGALQENGKPNAKSLEDRRQKIDELSQELREIDQQIQVVERDVKSLTSPVISSANALRDN